MADKTIGKVTHYYDHLAVAVIRLGKGAKLKTGDSVQIKGGETDFKQKVGSLQVEHKAVDAVKAGDDFGLKVDKPVREGYKVYSAK
ncbi:hypothetical protein HY380_02060 [Candidatus Saccharibacteria bacterium]|nr:hypothetical protein [Candidatus Saccharibacteria bacterium]